MSQVSQPTKEQLRQLVKDEDYEEIDRTKHHRHNEETVDIVVEFGGTHYMTSYYQSADDGIQWYLSFEDIYEVEEVEVVVKEWHIKKKSQ